VHSVGVGEDGYSIFVSVSRRGRLGRAITENERLYMRLTLLDFPFLSHGLTFSQDAIDEAIRW
jgi:hypothetical protein